MNWKHSFYQIYAITFGQSFTIDEAYRLLNELREDRLFAIASAFAETKRAKAKIIDAKMALEEFKNSKGFKAHQRRSEAAILETEARFIIAQPCLDMARAELKFIENCIRQIDQNSAGLRRMYEDFATGSQLVQPIEYAYEYTWLMVHEGVNAELMRNVWINPFAEQILNTVEEINSSQNNVRFRSRELVSKALARNLDISDDCLAISVNVSNMIGAKTPLMTTYAESHEDAMLKLERKANEQLSGPDHASIGVEGPNR